MSVTNGRCSSLADFVFIVLLLSFECKISSPQTLPRGCYHHRLRPHGSSCGGLSPSPAARLCNRWATRHPADTRKAWLDGSGRFRHAMSGAISPFQSCWRRACSLDSLSPKPAAHRETERPPAGGSSRRGRFGEEASPSPPTIQCFGTALCRYRPLETRPCAFRRYEASGRRTVPRS